MNMEERFAALEQKLAALEALVSDHAAKLVSAPVEPEPEPTPEPVVVEPTPEPAVVAKEPVK